MSQLKVNKPVGKNCYPDPTDVMIVQTCLQNIKAKTKFGMKPIWQGKIDGKNSKELACAIENFQTIEGLKVTGKVEAFSGQTFSKLKQRTPTSVLNKLVSDPYMGDLPNEHVFYKKQKKLKSLIQSISSLPHHSVGQYLVDFWKTLKELGDPIADTALDIHYRRHWGIQAINRLYHYLGDRYFEKFPPHPKELETIRLDANTYIKLPNEIWRRKQNEWIEEQVRHIQIAVAVEHWNEAAKDLKNIKGKLNPDQITTYHHDVFDRFGLPPEAFGGTPFNSDTNDWFNKFLATKVWCKECDIVEKIDE